ncbi:hypothetical protein [Chakrabartyella piscis]|uniref:hypothetical protein n=1 Tax=Chakrabartyella piscis TaxID=2918914 RepID=UPI0029589133|nr:hypothetical protein [Chakrabartyella piscis]
MKVKYIGTSDPCCLIENTVYECLGEEDGLFRIIDEEGYDEDEQIQGYLYEKELFETVSE